MTKTIIAQPLIASATVGEIHTLPSEAHGVPEKQSHAWRRKLLPWIIPVAMLFIVVLQVIPDLLQKWLWMRQLNYAGIFWTLLSVKWGMTCVAFVGAFLFLWINIRLAARNSFALIDYDTAKTAGSLEKTHVIEIGGIPFSRRAVTRTMALISGCSRRALCAWLLHAMGHLSPLSLWWFLRACGPHLWMSMSGSISFVFRSISFCRAVSSS